MRRAIPQGMCDKKFTANAPATADWLYDGFLARGKFTLRTGQWSGATRPRRGCVLAGEWKRGRQFRASGGVQTANSGTGFERESRQHFGQGDIPGKGLLGWLVPYRGASQSDKLSVRARRITSQ